VKITSASTPEHPDTTLPESEVDVLDTPEAGGRVIRGGAMLSATYFAGMLLTAVSVPFMVRGLGVDEFGVYVTASSASQRRGSVASGRASTSSPTPPPASRCSRT
jgi:hypothetical protein